MARFYMVGIQPMIDAMRAMHEESGEAAEAVIRAGAEEVKKAWKQAAEEFDHRVTGEMIESIGYPREPKDINGALTMDIYPQGKDSKGVRNAEKAFILHYGSTKLDGSHWVDYADQLCEATVGPAMVREWDKWIDKIMGKG